MNLTGPIESAELKFKQILEEFFISVYNEKHLSSHGVEHHRRVWNYAKVLTLLLGKFNLINDQDLPFRLIIASYLHDIGMSVETGVRHGKHSRDICTEFFHKYNLPENDYIEVFEAIENHDNKDYINSFEKYDILKILSVADDLDAFGYIGIYRYSEIYLARGINPPVIGQMIKNNAAARFTNFTNSFGFSEELIKEHKIRYDILENFFSNYHKQVSSYVFGGVKPEGYCGVIELLSILISNKKEPYQFFIEAEKYFYDPVIRCFFEGLKSEIS
jgi:HD superfamily phosphodiesterase